MVWNSTATRDGVIIPGEHNNANLDVLGLNNLDQTALTRWVRTKQALAAGVATTDRFYTDNDLLFDLRTDFIGTGGDVDSPIGLGSGVPSTRLAALDGEAYTSDINGAGVGTRGTVTTWAGITANPRSGIGGIRQNTAAIQSAVADVGMANNLWVAGLFKVNTNDTTQPFSIIARSAATDAEHIRLQFVQPATLTLVRRTASADTNEQTAFTISPAPGIYYAMGMRLTGTNVMVVFNGAIVFSGALSATAQGFTGTRAGISFRNAAVGNGACLKFMARSIPS